MSVQFVGFNGCNIVDFPLAVENMFLGPYTNDGKPFPVPLEYYW